MPPLERKRQGRRSRQREHRAATPRSNTDYPLDDDFDYEPVLLQKHLPLDREPTSRPQGRDVREPNGICPEDPDAPPLPPPLEESVRPDNLSAKAALPPPWDPDAEESDEEGFWEAEWDPIEGCPKHVWVPVQRPPTMQAQTSTARPAAAWRRLCSAVCPRRSYSYNGADLLHRARHGILYFKHLREGCFGPTLAGQRWEWKLTQFFRPRRTEVTSPPPRPPGLLGTEWTALPPPRERWIAPTPPRCGPSGRHHGEHQPPEAATK